MRTMKCEKQQLDWFLRVFEVTRVQVQRSARGSPKLWKSTTSGSKWVLLDQIKVHSSSLYVPTLLPYAGSTLNSFGRFSDIVFRWFIMLSCVIEVHGYRSEMSVALGEDSLQSLLSYVFSSNEYSLCCWSPENGHSPIHFRLAIMLWCPVTLYIYPSAIIYGNTTPWFNSFPAHLEIRLDQYIPTYNWSFLNRFSAVLMYEF